MFYVRFYDIILVSLQIGLAQAQIEMRIAYKVSLKKMNCISNEQKTNKISISMSTKESDHCSDQCSFFNGTM